MPEPSASTLPATPQHVLRRTALALETGEIRWGPGDFYQPDTGCRCTLGGIAYAVDPGTLASNPLWIRDPMGRTLARLAAHALAEWVTQRLDGVPAFDRDNDLDPLETVAEWNDRRERTAADVIEALYDAAEELDRAAVR